MRLLTFEEAGAAYGRTARTIQRWVAAGRLKTAISEGRLMVEVADDVEVDPRIRAADMTDNLSKLASAHTIQRTHDIDMLSGMVSDARSTRRWCRVTSGILAALLVSLAIFSHLRELRHVRQVVVLGNDQERLKARHVQTVEDLTAQLSKAAETAATASRQRDQLVEDVVRLQAQRDSALWLLGLPAPGPALAQIPQERP
ncbi:MAG: hypothetical protein JSU86_01760 [Phycisphaerales bacterium]|nr:MAG: hypothetical protein JSU86_01760 [Phycisphaerales bacterium]